MKNCRHLLTLALGLLLPVAPAAQAFELSRTGEAVKMADSTNSGYTYAYAPTIMYSEGKWHSYYCSAGTGVNDWDHVRYVASADLQNWIGPGNLVQPSVYERAACDPSVVRFDAGDGLYYYMMYSGNVMNVQTVNFLARSQRPEGPFLKYTSRGTWEQKPHDAKVIVWPKKHSMENSGVYGAGQPSLVVKDGTVYQFYTDVTAEPSGIYVMTSKNMIDWSEPKYTGAPDASIDVKYDDASGQFVMITMFDAHQKTSYLGYRTSKDGLNFSAPQIFCDKDCLPDWSHNIGVNGDEQGHIYGDELIMGFGAPYDLAPNDTWGRWDLYGLRFKLAQKGAVKGNIDGLGQNPLTVNGWACARQMSEQIGVHLYLNGPAGVGVMAGGVTANQPSEAAVGEACENGGKAHRFQIPITDSVLAANPGAKIYVHGLSPVGGANHLIGNSGTFTLPGSAAPAPQPPKEEPAPQPQPQPQPQPEPQGPRPGPQPEGFFKLDGDGIYYSNGNDAFCLYSKWEDFLMAGGRADLGNVRTIPGSTLPSMRNDGVCGGSAAAPAPAPTAPTPAPSAGPLGEVKGYIDEVTADGSVRGWACVERSSDPISVHIYVNAPAGMGQIVGSGAANQGSEPGVAAACSSTGSAHRFEIKLGENVRNAHRGQTVWVHGIHHDLGRLHQLLTNSGTHVVK